MGKYANVKYSKFVNSFLRWLATKERITVESGGKHVLKICYTHANRPFPIPKAGKEINRNIIAALQKKLEEWGVCTKEEFDERIK